MYASFGYLLEVYGLGEMHSPIRAVLTEILNNAFKANLKRLFFQENGYDFLKDYEAGNKAFRSLIHENQVATEKLSTRIQLPTSVHFECSAAGLSIRVHNQTPIHPLERKVVESILRDDISELNRPLTEAEGGGLGLKMVRYLMANLGLGIHVLQFDSDREGTAFTFHLPTTRSPVELLHTEISTSLRQAWPQLPQNNSVPDVQPLLHILNTGKNPHSTKTINSSIDKNQNTQPEQSSSTELQGDLNGIATIQGQLVPGAPIDLKYAAWCYPLAHGLINQMDENVLNTIRSLTGRSKPPRHSPLESATLGIRPHSLLQLWARTAKEDSQPAILAGIEQAAPVPLESWQAYVINLLQLTGRRTTRHEFDWSAFLSGAEHELQFPAEFADQIHAYQKARSS